jgi:hypothetical protein
LRAVLLVVTAAMFAGSLATFTGVMSTVRDAAARTAPAVLEVMAARWALVQADSSAMASFQTGLGGFIGPSKQYQEQIAIASQNLAKVAEHNSAGEEGSRALQLVEGLVVAYGRWIEDADAHFRADAVNSQGATPIGVADLWFASRLMHGTDLGTTAPSGTADSGIIDQLDTLEKTQHNALDTQLSQGWMSPAGALAWLLPALILLGFLLVAQIFLNRRFSRTFNPALVVATVLLGLVVAGMWTVFDARNKSDAASGTLNSVVNKWDAQTRSVAVDGQRELAEMVRKQCGSDCGETAGPFIARFADVARSAQTADQVGIDETKQVNSKLAAADQSGFLNYSLPLGVLMIAALVLLGLQSGIDEYRYQAS